MSKSKLRKSLKKEVDFKFNKYLNGDLKKTKDEVIDYCKVFEDKDVEYIRKEKLKIKDLLDNLKPSIEVKLNDELIK